MAKIMLNNIEYGGGSNIDITTTLDENSTDAQVPSAKAVYENLQNIDAETLDGYDSTYFASAKYIRDNSLWYDLTEGFDLNKALGRYRTSNSSIVISLINKPSYVGSGEVTVEWYPASSGNLYGMQVLRFTTSAKSTIYYRMRQNDTWSGWTTTATTADLEKYLPLTGGVVNGSVSFQSVDNGYCGITKMHDETDDNGMLLQDGSKDGKIAAIKICANSGLATFHTSANDYNELLHTGNMETYIGSNVPKTNFVFTNNTNWTIPNTNLETFFCVRNSWCYLHVTAHCNIVANDSNSIVYSGLPKPLAQIYSNFVGSDYTYSPCQLTINTNGQMLLRGGTVGKDYSFTYTYPIAE